MSQKTPRLLVVDDDLGVIAAYRLVLESSDDRSSMRTMFGLDKLQDELFGAEAPEDQEWRVTFLDQGIDAVNTVRWATEDGDPFTAIFLDVRMPPGIDGYETAEQIRKIDPSVHIVIVTGYSDYTPEQFAEIAGGDDKLTYLSKPVWPDQLRNMARQLTARHRVVPKGADAVVRVAD